MASRKLAQISRTLTSSKKISGHKSDSPRWTYICARLSELGNYSGLFWYPLGIWANDAGKIIDALTACIQVRVSDLVLHFKTQNGIDIEPLIYKDGPKMGRERCGVYFLRTSITPVAESEEAKV